MSYNKQETEQAIEALNGSVTSGNWSDDASALACSYYSGERVLERSNADIVSYLSIALGLSKASVIGKLCASKVYAKDLVSGSKSSKPKITKQAKVKDLRALVIAMTGSELKDHDLDTFAKANVADLDLLINTLISYSDQQAANKKAEDQDLAIDQDQA